MPAGEIRVVGLKELNRALGKVATDTKKMLRDELKVVAEPVRALAAQKAAAEISHIGPAWSRMRVGVTTSLVYVAPAARNRGGSPRSNLGSLLMDRAMQPALNEMSPVIEAGLEKMLDRVGTDFD